MLEGYAGKILEVDLDDGELKDLPLDEEMAKMYLGGKGLGLKLVYNEFRPDMQPFDPDNLLVFATGPATGARVPTSGRYPVVCSKSPQTGTVGSGNSGGNWGPLPEVCGIRRSRSPGDFKRACLPEHRRRKSKACEGSGNLGMTVHAVTDELTERTGEPKKTSVAWYRACRRKPDPLCQHHERQVSDRRQDRAWGCNGQQEVKGYRGFRQ